MHLVLILVIREYPRNENKLTNSIKRNNLKRKYVLVMNGMLINSIPPIPARNFINLLKNMDSRDMNT